MNGIPTKYLFLLLPILLLGACKKSILQLNNPVSPTPESSLITEGGIEAFAQGIYEKWVANETGDGLTNFFDIDLLMESGMADEEFSPYSNWGGRFPSIVASITLPAAYGGTVIPNPSGFANQEALLNSNNSRAAGDQNSLQYAWDVFYYMNAQANTLLQALANPALKLTGDAATKKNLLQAWAYYWKGYCYSKLGSLYLAAVIDDSPDSTSQGLTSGTYVVHDSVISAANRNFDVAASIFGSITENGDYDATFEAMIPSFNLNTQIITPAMWVRQIRSYEARNFLANHKVATMSASDWNTVQTLAANGMVQGDFTLQFGEEAGGVNDLSTFGGFIFHPFERVSISGGALSFVSERLIQDYQPGDHRFTKNFDLYPTGTVVNVRTRGIQFGTRYGAIDIENGGSYASETRLGTVPIAPTWEENSLMIAEAKIRSGSDINGGLQLIDQVRTADSAYLPPLAGSGISQDSAIEQLRSERRVGLFMRGVSWYDTRRWGVNTPAAQGGGRANAIVIVPGPFYSTNQSAPAIPISCFIDYSYVDYWDVPQNELDFNPAAASSAPIHN